MGLFSRRPAARLAARSSRLTVQQLETRVNPVLTYHGGPLLRHVDLQNLYLGDGWLNSAARTSEINRFEAMTRYIVKSPYMDMLTKAGYHVYRGKSETGLIDPVALGSSVDDVAVQNEIKARIASSDLELPNKNRLYQVFIAPNVVVTHGSSNSVSNFLAYHSSFHMQDTKGKDITVAYSIMPYQGTGGNAIASSAPLTNFDAICEASTHELAEAATDPLVNETNIKLTGWWDETTGNENGDVVNQQVCVLNGWVVQKSCTPNLVTVAPKGSFDYFVYSPVFGLSSSAGDVSAFTPFDSSFSMGRPTGFNRLLNQNLWDATA